MGDSEHPLKLSGTPKRTYIGSTNEVGGVVEKAGAEAETSSGSVVGRVELGTIYFTAYEAGGGYGTGEIGFETKKGALSLYGFLGNTTLYVGEEFDWINIPSLNIGTTYKIGNSKYALVVGAGQEIGIMTIGKHLTDAFSESYFGARLHLDRVSLYSIATLDWGVENVWERYYDRIRPFYHGIETGADFRVGERRFAGATMYMSNEFNGVAVNYKDKRKGILAEVMGGEREGSPYVGFQVSYSFGHTEDYEFGAKVRVGIEPVKHAATGKEIDTKIPYISYILVGRYVYYKFYKENKELIDNLRSTGQYEIIKKLWHNYQVENKEDPYTMESLYKHAYDILKLKDFSVLNEMTLDFQLSELSINGQDVKRNVLAQLLFKNMEESSTIKEFSSNFKKIFSKTGEKPTKEDYLFAASLMGIEFDIHYDEKIKDSWYKPFSSKSEFASNLDPEKSFGALKTILSKGVAYSKEKGISVGVCAQIHTVIATFLEESGYFSKVSVLSVSTKKGLHAFAFAEDKESKKSYIVNYGNVSELKGTGTLEAVRLFGKSNNVIESRYRKFSATGKYEGTYKTAEGEATERTKKHRGPEKLKEHLSR